MIKLRYRLRYPPYPLGSKNPFRYVVKIVRQSADTGKTRGQTRSTNRRPKVRITDPMITALTSTFPYVVLVHNRGSCVVHLQSWIRWQFRGRRISHGNIFRSSIVMVHPCYLRFQIVHILRRDGAIIPSLQHLQNLLGAEPVFESLARFIDCLRR